MTAANPRMAGLAPDEIECLHAAARAIRDRIPDQAERLIAQVLAAQPRHAEALRLLGILQLHTQRAPQAIATLRQAIEWHAGDALLQAELGNAHSARGERAEAIAAWRRSVALDPSQAVPWFDLGRALQSDGDCGSAVEALGRAWALAPDLLPAAILLGDALAHLGRFEEATARYRDALRLHPACGDAWRGLSNIKNIPLSDADATLLSAQLQRRDIADSDRVAMGHALGKLGEDRGEYPRAFAAFTTANALRQRLTPWRLAPFEAFVAQALAMTEHLPAALDPTLGREAIFIVGLPRSGSTLFEQILAAHPQVEGASELQDLGIVLQQESVRRGVPYPQWIPQAGADDWQRLGREYLARTARWRATRPRFTDKLPDNWKHASVLRAMLPGATIIETRRDPLETAWSCFKQQFYSQPHFANTLADLGAYLRGCERAMEVWRARSRPHPPAPLRRPAGRSRGRGAAPAGRLRAGLRPGLPGLPCGAAQRAHRQRRPSATAAATRHRAHSGVWRVARSAARRARLAHLTQPAAIGG